MLDVEVRGKDTLFVLLNRNGLEGGLHLSSSVDGGKSWKTVAISGDLTGWTGPANLLVLLPRVFVARQRLEEGALAQLWPHWRVWEVNPETGAETYMGNSIDLPFAPHFEGHDGSVSGMWGEGYAGTSVLRWKTTNVLTGQTSGDGFICEEQRCAAHGGFGYPIGARFYAYSWVIDDGQPNQLCRIVVNPVDDAVGYHCTSAPLVQSFFNPDPAVFENQLWARVERDGHLLLAQPDAYAPDRLRVIDLGEGRLGPRQWKDLVAVDSSPGASALVRLKNNRPAPVVLPPTPCISHDACLGGGVFGPQGGIRFVLPVEGSRYWVFYSHKEVRDTNESGSEIGSFREAIYAALEDDANAGATVTAPTELEKMCARVQSCFPSEPNADLRACAARWSELNAASSAADLRYQAFLRTPPGCESFRVTDPLAAHENPFACQTGCYAETAWSCPSGTGGVGSSCLYFGTRCLVGEDGLPGCEKPAGCTGTERKCEGNKAITCPDMITDCTALGLTCVVRNDNPLCLPDLPPCSGTRFCDGAVARPCWSGGTAGWDGIDCARTGLQCLDGECVPGLTDQLCTDPYARGGCEGTKLRYCLSSGSETSPVSRERVLDCAELGLACVAVEGGGARCGQL